MKRWAAIPGYPGYEVSANGKVRCGNRMLKLREISGYRRAYIKGAKEWLVHRLVYLAFVGPITPGNHINHKNGIRHDNRVSNLEDITPLENVQDGFKRRYRGLPRLKFKNRDNVEKGFQASMAGGAAKKCGLANGPVFLKWAKMMNLEPMGRIFGGHPIFYKPDVEKMACSIKKFKQRYSHRCKLWQREAI